MSQMSTGNIVVAWSVATLAAVGSVTGLWLLAVTPGKTTVIAVVGFSTIVAFLLFVLSV